VREITGVAPRATPVSQAAHDQQNTNQAGITPTKIKPVAVSNANQHLKQHEQVAVTTKTQQQEKTQGTDHEF